VITLSWRTSANISLRESKRRSPRTTTTPPRELRERARALGLHGIVLGWDELASEPWIPRMIEIEEQERARRSLERRLRNARTGRFKPIADFDWKWPQQVPRQTIEELLTLDFVAEPANVVLLGPNGIGKTMIAKNLAHQALLAGFTVRFTTASDCCTTWQPKTPTSHWQDASGATSPHSTSSSTRWATFPTTVATQICSS